MTTMLFVSVGQDIIIINEGPQSLLIPAGHIGSFTCKSCCTHCFSHWVINKTPVQYGQGGHAELERMGFTFSEEYFNQSHLLCHVMMVNINASESVNGSSILCEYCPTFDQQYSCQRIEATLLVTTSKVVLSY